MMRVATILCLVGLAACLTGCGEDESSDSNEFGVTTTRPATAPAGDLSELPPGHPPIDQPLPEGHPPLGTMPSLGHPPMRPIPPDVHESPFSPPEPWVQQEPRFMTVAVYNVPRAEGDQEDADLAVSMLATLVPLEMNVARWKGQFEFPEGTDMSEAVNEYELDGAKYPTTVVEITGTYTPGSMTDPSEPPPPPKPGYRMLAAQVVIDGKPWYAKLVGPDKTVAHWEDRFLEFVRSAK